MFSSAGSGVFGADSVSTDCASAGTQKAAAIIVVTMKCWKRTDSQCRCNERCYKSRNPPSNALALPAPGA